MIAARPTAAAACATPLVPVLLVALARGTTRISPKVPRWALVAVVTGVSGVRYLNLQSARDLTDPARIVESTLAPYTEIARARGIPVLEDCSQSHGSRYKGRRVGTIGDISAFSTMRSVHVIFPILGSRVSLICLLLRSSSVFLNRS